MQVVCFKKSDYPAGKLKNAERYECSVANGVILGVALVGALSELDDGTWQAPRAEVASSCPATADNALALFRKAADDVGGYAVNEAYVRALFDEDETNAAGEAAASSSAGASSPASSDETAAN